MNPNVDRLIDGLSAWQEEVALLRAITIDAGLTEEWKWKAPCYTDRGKNVAIIGHFKAFCTLSFFKGVLLSDPHQVLVAPGKDSQTTRQFTFTSVEQIRELEPVIRAYIREAVEVERSGVEVLLKKTEEYERPEELERHMAANPDFKAAFEALTPGRQRGYLLHFSAPKQSATRKSRIDKYHRRIMCGKGFHDCVCGMSGRFPRCDGTHKTLPPEERERLLEHPER